MKRTLEQRVLNWVNRKRAKEGLPPLGALLPGRSGDPRACPLARSLAAGLPSYEPAAVYGTYWRWWRGPTQELPRYVASWVGRLDSG